MRTTLPVPVPGSVLEASASTALRIRRAFSLSGVLPLGAFLVVHLSLNARALRGGWAFAGTVDALDRLPGLPIIEALFVFAPLVFHGALGLWLVATRRPLSPQAPYPRGLRLAMRATGVVVLAFLCLHLSALRFRVPGTRLDGGELATLLDAGLSTTSHGVPWQGLVYLVGTACVTLHFACGLWGFYATTRAGRENGRRRQLAAWGSLGLGLAMWVTFADVVILRATGSALFGADPSPPPATRPCPVPVSPGEVSHVRK
jgi:succinate dehydrogenase / fumarate reductase, cytochrome b subunit